MIYILHSENFLTFQNIKYIFFLKQLLKLVGKTVSWTWLQHYNNKSSYKSESRVELFHSHAAEINITSKGK